MKIVCPNCGGEDEIPDEADRDLREGCVRVERVTCPHCQVARALFVQYPHEDG